MNIKELKKQIINKNPVELLIGSFIFFYFFSFLFFSLGWFQFQWVALPYSWDDFIAKPWTILTYSFFHARFIALLFNSVLLFYFGSIFLSFFDEKKFLKIYFSGVIAGGLAFLLSYKLFPGFYVQKGPLLGASAGIMAVMTYIAIKYPSYPLKIRFIGNFKILHILIFFLAFNLLQIPLGNPGGYFAHLGGLGAGLIWFYVEKIFNRKRKRKATVFEENTGNNYKLNRILEKINSSGYDSLTDEEKEFLFRQGK